MIHVPSLLLAKHSPVTALAETTYCCKPEPHDQARLSAEAETDVSDGFAAEALF